MSRALPPLTMISVFLSHSSKDKDFVRDLAAFLEGDGQIKVWLDERQIAPGQNIVARIAEGLESDFILLILSPDSVESNWVKEEWTDAFWEQTNHGKTKLLGVLCRDCQLPPLLRNKRYFDLRTNQPQGFREIRTFLLTGKPAPPLRVNTLPVRPPLFVERESELAQLRERLRQPGALVPICGLPGKGKTTLALEFAHRWQQDFEAVHWLPCQSSTLASLAAELSRQLGLKFDCDLPEIVRELKGVCGNQRCLLILDNVEDEAPRELIPGGAASVLVTTRFVNLRFLRFHPPLDLSVFTEDQCFELFRRQIGAEEVAHHEAACRSLCQRLGYLPIAVAISAALIREDVRYTIPGMARNLPDDVTSLIREAIAALDAAPQRLLAAMSACAPGGFYLDLAAEIAALDETAALAALQQLYARSLVEEIDRTDRRYRLHALVRETANAQTFALTHAEAVRRRFENWELGWRHCRQELPDLQLAFEWALRNSVNSVAQDLAYYGYALTHRIGRLTEAFDFCERIRPLLENLDNREALQAVLGNQATLLQAWGRSDEALALYQKQETICVELGNRQDLQGNYGAQAIILYWRGRLQEAWSLLEKQQIICKELGHQSGLQTCYGNQAVILKAWGRLHEALALLKKQETICLELSDQHGLQANYGNQALILQMWNRLDEAMAFHKKAEAICVESGDQDGLQLIYGNQAVILQAQGRLDDALVLYKKQEAMCLELNNKIGLQASYGNQASVLKASGRLEEALALHKQEESLCGELGYQDGLQRSYGNQALILNALRRPDEALALHRKAEAICEKLGNLDALQGSYGNQAVILRNSGHLDEALALIKKKEALCLQLGKRNSLAFCYWNWGLIERAHGDLDAAQAKLSEALALFQELGMIREEAEVETELAGIRSGWTS